ncbi:hypothetical protein MSG28_007950 [Choristoneura fumiferana]|uniref:Uncharacterized protein n=1 Tax=Choristoneura fumiferana TaxID=7141 RepID=A0ACC0J9C5_CHOFU|nr:hypothetical protein MSG28_007950 [Choristoneura fumiferana]
MSDDKERKEEPTQDSVEPGQDKKKTGPESDTTESDLDTQESGSDKQTRSDASDKTKQPEKSKQDLQKIQSLKAVSSKPQLSKPDLPKLDIPKPTFHPLSPPTPESPTPALKKISRLGSVLLKKPKERQPPGAPGDASRKKKWWQNCYDKENKSYCGRTCQSWMYIVAYSIMYLIFLSTYTMIFLYVSLVIIKANNVYLDETVDFQYLKSGIGLTATPTTEDSSPMIWYRRRHVDDYQKYVNALERLLNQRRRNASDYKYLGACGEAPFGYGDTPCVIVRINKNWGWRAKPVQPDATDVPSTVQHWAQRDAKLWLHCGGQHPYDTEHIGNIKYIPDPPGFDPSVFPLTKDSESPLIGVQFSNFTLGVSIVVECKLWYKDGSSSVDFVLFVGT